MPKAQLTGKNARRALLALSALAVLFVWFLTGRLHRVAEMPGESFTGILPAWTANEIELAERLEDDVNFLAEELGPRSIFDQDARRLAGEWIQERIRSLGLTPHQEPYEPPAPSAPTPELLEQYLLNPSHINTIVRLGGPSDAPLLVVSAHFDTVPGSPGADDDATGVAALLELAARFAEHPIVNGKLRLELCFFDGEEAGLERMGSRYYAQNLSAAGQNVAGAISLEMLGYFTAEPDSQELPSMLLRPYYPTTGNFLGFVGNQRSGDLIRRAVGAFRGAADFPSEGMVAPDSMEDAGRSDHANFWAEGWPGLMVSDTANFRYEHYHEPTDTPDRVDFLRLARITRGLEQMIRTLASESW